MSRKQNAKIAPANDVQETATAAEQAQPEPTATEQSAAEPKAPVGPKARGPRGVDESAVITVLAKDNPKRAGTRAFELFKAYVDGMTVKAYCDALKALGTEEDKQSTPALVYDAKHGYISIAGYDPGQIVQPKPKAEKKPKEPKAPKGKKEVVAKSDPEHAAALAEETATESMD